MTIRNRGLRTDRHQDSKEDRARWESVLTAWEKPTDPSLLRMWQHCFPKEKEPFKPQSFVPPLPIRGSSGGVYLVSREPSHILSNRRKILADSRV